MAKKKTSAAKGPKKDFAQTALANVLKLTKSKNLVEPTVIPFPDGRKGKS